MKEEKRYELFSRISKLSSEHHDKYIKLVKPEVDKILEEKIPKDCWTLTVKMKEKDVIVKINLITRPYDERNENVGTEYIGKNIEIDNKYVWDYVVNVKYYKNNKTFSFRNSYELFDPITLETDTYLKLDEIDHDEEFIKLKGEWNIINRTEIIYENLSPANSLGGVDNVMTYISDNLEKIREVYDEKILNNIMERIRIISSMETGRFQELYPELAKKIDNMSTEEFIEYVDSYIDNERRLYRFPRA